MKRLKFSFLIAALAALQPFIGFTSLTAQCNKLSIDVTDTLIIKGIWNPDAITANGYIQFALDANGSGSVSMISSPLTHVKSERDKIQAANISMATMDISPGLPQNAIVTVNSAPKPGTYIGEVIFYITGEQTCKKSIILKVELGTSNEVKALDSTITYDIVKTKWLNFILPAAMRNGGFNFRIENPGIDPVELDGYSLSMMGEKTGRALQSDEVVFYEWDDKRQKLSEDTLDLRGKVLPPQSDITFVCKIKQRGHLSPDTYSGRLKLRFADAKTPEVISLTMNVRAGVLGVILVMILGIIVGRQVTKLESPEVKAQMALMPRLLKLRRDADKIKVSGAEDAAHQELDELEMELNAVKGAEEEIVSSFNTRFNSMGAKLSTLLALDDLDMNIHEQPLKVDKHKLHEKTGKIRELIFEKEIAAIQPLIDEVTSEVANAVATSSSGGTRSATRGTASVDDPVTRQLNKVNRSLLVLKTDDKQQRGIETEVLNWWQKFKKWWRKIIVAIMGVSVSAGTRFWFIRPMVTALFFVGFLLFGFHSLYIQNGFNFGLNGLYDYFQIFLWGATSDIVSRKVGDLGGGSGLAGLKLKGGNESSASSIGTE